MNGYKLKKTPKVSIYEPVETKSVTQIAAPAAAVLTLNEIVQKVKESLLNELSQNGARPKDQIVKPKQYHVPMKVINEEVLFEATHDDDKPKYYSHYYRPIPLINAGEKASPKENTYDGAKKVRFVKQVLVPANSNKEESVYVSQSSYVQQPNLYQTNLERQLSLQQSLYQRTNLAEQVALMQKQIDQLTQNAQDKSLKKKSALETPHLNIEAIDAHFHILPHADAKTDENKTNESQDGQVKLEIEDNAVSVENTAEPLQSVVENEQFLEEDTAKATENEETKDKPEEFNSSEMEQAQEIAKANAANVDDAAKLREDTKVHTQEFGNTDAGEPIVEKTYNFNAPVKDKEVDTSHVNVPVGSARKVMLL